MIYSFSKLFGISPQEVETNYELTEAILYLTMYAQDNAYEKQLMDNSK